MSEQREQGPAAAPTGMAARLGATRVGLRTDLEVTRHMFRGRPSYLFRDPLTYEVQRFELDDYRVLQRIEPSRSLAEAFEELVEEELLTTSDEEDFYFFVLQLHQQNFLQLPISDDKMLYRRYEALQRSRRCLRSSFRCSCAV